MENPPQKNVRFGVHFDYVWQMHITLALLCMLHLYLLISECTATHTENVCFAVRSYNLWQTHVELAL